VVPRGERSSNTPDLLDNLQVWAEYNYNTDYLHRNLAFPLLRALTDAGDLKAKKVFKNEIGRRYESGGEATREYLREEGFLKYLTDEELNSLI